MIKIAGTTDIGKKRATNQDAFEIAYFDDGTGVAVICDGMGGPKGGDEASRMAVSVIRQKILQGYKADFDDEAVKQLMHIAAHEANKSIFSAAKMNDKLTGMGTTMVLTILREKQLHLIHAGDSRAYLISADGEMTQLTRDHSLVQNMVESGEITPDEATNHPQKNVITRALGIFSDIEIDYSCITLQTGDKVLLCTDGLCGFISDEEILDIFTANQKESVENLPQLLVDAANDAGGGDNITAVVLKIEL